MLGNVDMVFMVAYGAGSADIPPANKRTRA